MKMQACPSGAVLVFAFALVTHPLNSAEQPAKTKETVVQRFQMNPYHVNIGKIAAVKPDGQLTVKDVANPLFILRRRASGMNDLAEGRYLGFVGKDFVETTKDTRLVSLRVTEIGKGNVVTVRVSATAAAKIKPGEDLLFFRPPGSTTKDLTGAPDFLAVDDGEDATILDRKTPGLKRVQEFTRDNLHQFGIAMHNYHEQHGFFPPAVVYGPDGKPWHSWRVLLLPFLDEPALAQEYRFTEPWDGPNNKKLLKRMPSLFHDPIYGRQKSGEYFTNYVAITGKGTYFPATGVKMKSKKDQPFYDPKREGIVAMRNITDGLTYSLMIGQAGPEHAIPWTKPQDIILPDKGQPVGGKGQFGAPFHDGTTAFGFFLYGDGHVSAIPATIPLKDFRELALCADRKVPLQWTEGIKERRSPEGTQFVEIVRTPKGLRARLVSRTVK